MNNKAPIVPPYHWLLRNFNKLAHDPLNFMSECNTKYGGIVNLNISPWVDVYLIAEPEFVKHILIDNHKKYKKSFAYKILKFALGNGLLTNEGESWLEQRRIAQPAFHRERLAAFADGVTSTVQKMIDQWHIYAKADTVVDVSNEFMKLTTEIAAKAMFSTDIGVLKDGITENINIVNQYIMERVSSPFRIPLWVPTRPNLQFKNSLRKLDVIIYDFINTRRVSKESHYDLLSMLMEAKDEESGEQMNDLQLRDELMTLFLAGSETSSNALAWTFYLIARNPDVKKNMYDEIKEELKGNLPNAENILKLKYLSMVIQESMRLYPPAWVIGREAIEDDFLGDIKIKKGSQLYISPFVIQRSQKFHNDPMKFNPSRFNSEPTKTRPKFSYFPFGAGPRFCIGNNFAIMEITIALVMIAQNNLSLQLMDEKVDTEPLVTLRPKDGLKVRIVFNSEKKN